MTTVYSNTNKSFKEWEPEYKIYFFPDTNRFVWLHAEHANLSIEISNNLIKEYKKDQKFNLLYTEVPRYKFVVFKNITAYLKVKGFSMTVDYDRANTTVRIRKF